MLLKGLINIAPTVHRLSSVRTGVVLKRYYPLKPDNNVTGPLLLKGEEVKSYVYSIVGHTDQKPAGDIDLILAVDINGMGCAGDTVTVKKKLARSDMLPTGVGLYVTPRNIQKTEHLRKENEGKVRQPESAYRTLKELSGMTTSIPMSAKVEWVLNKTHVKVGFRICGVELNEDCITLPEEPIKAPGDYFVQIQVNKLNTVQVKLHVYHFDSLSHTETPSVWSRDPQHKYDLIEVIADATRNLKKRII